MKKTILHKLILVWLSFSTLFSCSKDDDPINDANTAPVINAQSFNASEVAIDTDVFGKVVATDAENDELTFSIKTNSNSLFEITQAGDISLAPGKILDFEMATSHILSVDVSDGEFTSNASITITVINVNVAPTLAAQTFFIDENSDINTLIGSIVATDADGDSLTFSSVNIGSLFALSTIGELTIVGDLNFEVSATYTISVTANDGQLSTTEQVVININDVKEFPILSTNQNFIVAEDIDDTVVIGNIAATDEDGDDLSYTIQSNPQDADGNPLFEISATGDVSLINGRNLDFELRSRNVVIYQVSKTNDTNFSVSSSFEINVTDVAETTLVTGGNVSTIAGSKPNALLFGDVDGAMNAERFLK